MTKCQLRSISGCIIAYMVNVVAVVVIVLVPVIILTGLVFYVSSATQM